MEKRDLYDENKILTGETIFKGEPIPQGKYYITVVAFVRNSKGEFLLEQLPKAKNNFWSFPGGHPKSGESSLDGIVIELDEELGIKVTGEKLKLFETIKTEDDFVDLYYTTLDMNIADVVIQKEEVESAKWASIEEIEKMIKEGIFLPPHIDFYKLYLDYMRNNK
ncbi:MAG: hypothetical protein A2Y24_06020 [Clostridiales bacterium GWE2_32_10]|nr:MAG: hypothetical protein A2Y24_06020 [Clostridiales bacterium GWE2_32_10]HBY20856.1 hypothetical protein [Clostridiales bacterium]